MPQFSIIVPAYNNAQYLEACLTSILQQDYDSWEAVIVVDASPDNSLEISQGFASKDKRFKVVNKEQNGGLHLARKTGVAQTVGNYVTFLDADDEFFPGTLSALSNVIEQDGAVTDIIHFGLRCVETSNISKSACEGFEKWANSEDARLSVADVMRKTFAEEGAYCHDWNMHHRLFSGNLIRSVFEQLSSQRLVSAEDGYEYFALVSQSNGELVRDSIAGYKYFIGRGVTTSNELSAKEFESRLNKFAACINSTLHYASEHKTAVDGSDLIRPADGFKTRLVFSLANEWFERVSPADKVEAAKAAFKVVDKVQFASEMARFVNDKAYAMFVADDDPAEKQVQEIESWLEAAKAAVEGVEIENKEYARYFVAAKDHLSYVRRRMNMKNPARDEIAIYVATHKRVDLYNSKILQPIQVGTNENNAFEGMLHDNEGENIGELNPMYCELTAQYWAWKNSDAPFIGFCHYRRYFDFSEGEHEENKFGEIDDVFIDINSQRNYMLDDNSICAALQDFDVVTTREQDIRQWEGESATNRSMYSEAPHLHVEDLDAIVAILLEKHPEYEQDALEFLADHKACFCNMYVMKREIFNDYCEWLFPLLEAFCKTADMTYYSHEGLRTPGHLAERLFNIYMRHNVRTGAGWKIKQVQCVHFSNPEKHTCASALDSTSNPQNLPVVPVVFAADNPYVPMLTTTLYSMLKNASTSHFYDIYVLQKNIESARREVIWEFFYSKFANVHIQFVDVSPIVSKYNLKTNNPHISEETYYRFLIQELIPHYNKVVYLDSDLIVKDDVSQLFSVEMGTNLVAAVPDIDFTGNVNMTDGTRMKYITEVLEMKDPYSYFQAGVLVLNTQEMRELYSMEKWLEFASDNRYIYNDQDVLNAHCQGRVTYLPYEWNVMNDCGGRIKNVFSHAPAPNYDAYIKSRKNEKIVHYAGFEKPWMHVFCDRFELYWQYAKETPFYERLLEHLCFERIFWCMDGQVKNIYEQMDERFKQAYADMDAKVAQCVKVKKHESVVGEESSLRKIVDPIAPLGSHRREALKVVGRTLRGRK